MTSSSSCHLVDILAEVPDPRHKKGKRPPLSSILALIVIGLLVNHKGYTSIATWARNQPELTQALGFTFSKTPCAATIHNLLKRLDVVRLEAALTKWVFSEFERYQASETQDLEGVAIDGKELCGSKDRETGFRTHLLSAVSHEIGVVLAECAVDGKTNEIPISTELLKCFDIVGKVFTTDALLTQKTFCEAIIEKRADYALPVKENQRSMYADIQDLFNPLSQTDPPEVEKRRFENLHTEAEAHLDAHTNVEEARGCITTRKVTASTLLTDHINWPGLAQVYRYETHKAHTKTGQTQRQTQYCMTSLSPEVASAKDLLKLQRGHWTIENKVHWVRDTTFREDASQARTGSIPHVMAALRNTAMAVLRFNGYTKIAETLRLFASQPKLAVNLIL
ncbi:ISAs1 family transposase [Candidatus Poribacteria bacterium]|nr:ISAs1 family transposase [Candidatus Poribacteria bacterium]